MQQQIQQQPHIPKQHAAASKIICILIVVVLLLAYTPQQSHALMIRQPAHLRGFYGYAISAFGTPYFSAQCPMRQEIVLINPIDGCHNIQQDVFGKIALVKRGVCTFTQKVRKAQQAGAIGVIVVNDEYVIVAIVVVVVLFINTHER